MMHPPLQRGGLGAYSTNEFEAMSSEAFDLFSKPICDVSVIDSSFDSISPINSYGHMDSIQFNIPCISENHYLMPGSIKLCGYFSVVKPDPSDASKNVPLVSTDKVSVINMAASSLFKHVDLSLNNESAGIQHSGNLAFKNFLELELSHSPDMKTSHLPCYGYIPDAPLSKYKMVGTGNTGYEKRKTMIQASPVYFEMPMSVDFLATNVCLPPWFDLSLKFVRNDDKFILMVPEGTTTAFKIVLTDLKLNLIRLQVKPSLAADHLLTLKKKPAKFNYLDTSLKSYPVGKNDKFLRLRITDVHETIPAVFHVAMLESSRYEGQKHENPWVFSHFNLESVRLKQNGQLIRPELEFKDPNSPTDKGVIQSYRQMMGALGLNPETGQTNGISVDQFKSVQFILSYDMSYDYCGGFHLHYARTLSGGTLDMEISWKTALTENITILVYQIHYGLLQFDRNKKIKIDKF